jgi:hypothetical protein
VRQACLDLLGSGAVSAPVLAGELIKRQLVAKDQPVGHAYVLVRAALAELVAEGRAQAWPDGYCWSISARTPVDE